MKLVSQLAERPESSIPAACASKANSKAAYRFLSNEAIAAAALRQGHQQATAQRVAQEPERVLIAQDTTNLDFTGKPATSGLGPLDSVHARGLKVHSALAMSSQGVPLGVLHQEVWVREEAAGKRGTRRKRAMAEKESQRWRSTLVACEERLAPEVDAWILGDRESDIYELFAAPRRAGMDLLVRAAQNRKVEHRGELSTLWEAGLASAVRARHTIEVPRGKNGQPERQATLEVRYTTLALQPPRHARQRSSKSPVPLSVVHVREVGAPAGQTPLEWLLLCTQAIGSVEAALFCLEAYRQR